MAAFAPAPLSGAHQRRRSINGNRISTRNADALCWLEAIKQPPEIVADKAITTNGYQLYVPDNVGDLVAKQWLAGKYFDSKNHPIDISGYRTEKRVCPLRLAGDAAVHYLCEPSTMPSSPITATHSLPLPAPSRASAGVLTLSLPTPQSKSATKPSHHFPETLATNRNGRRRIIACCHRRHARRAG